MWKQVLRKEQSPRLSSVCLLMIRLRGRTCKVNEMHRRVCFTLCSEDTNRKCSFVHGCGVSPERTQSSLVPWSQNSWTWARPRERNFSTMDCSFAVLAFSSSRISLLTYTWTLTSCHYCLPTLISVATIMLMLCETREETGPSPRSSYLLALLFFSGLLVQETLYLHVDVGSLTFAVPTLLVSAAP